ncbi:MAG: hypothetical protein ACK559_00175, partial [bacterium]
PLPFIDPLPGRLVPDRCRIKAETVDQPLGHRAAGGDPPGVAIPVEHLRARQLLSQDAAAQPGHRIDAVPPLPEQGHGLVVLGDAKQGFLVLLAAAESALQAIALRGALLLPPGLGGLLITGLLGGLALLTGQLRLTGR